MNSIVTPRFRGHSYGAICKLINNKTHKASSCDPLSKTKGMMDEFCEPTVYGSGEETYIRLRKPRNWNLNWNNENYDEALIHKTNETITYYTTIYTINMMFETE
eukprot:1061446_1